jgi:hypothetical protein
MQALRFLATCSKRVRAMALRTSARKCGVPERSYGRLLVVRLAAKLAAQLATQVRKTVAYPSS